MNFNLIILNLKFYKSSKWLIDLHPKGSIKGVASITNEIISIIMKGEEGSSFHLKEVDLEMIINLSNLTCLKDQTGLGL